METSSVPHTEPAIPTPAQVDPDVERLRAEVRAVLDSLTEEERRWLRLRFGLEDGRHRTLAEACAAFRVSAARGRAIEAQALHKLRHPARVAKLYPPERKETRL